MFKTRYDIFPELCSQQDNMYQVLDRALRCRGLISMYGCIRQYVSPCGETAHGVPHRRRIRFFLQ
jgi:hypothetical protein